jgi:cysteine-rich repeat protein
MRIWLAALVVVLVACGGSNKKSATCGDGKIDPGEECDGEPNCTSQCTWTCSDPTMDCTPVECEVAMCTTDHACTTASAQDGTACTNGLCAGGICVHPTCGNGTLEAGEQCDFGVDNGSVPGCQVNCMFSCETGSNSCDDGDPCNGVETCGTVTDNGATGQACQPGTPAQDGTSCGTNMLCKNAACVAAFCGDGYVTGTEECDDGNTISGDGCENNCTFSCVSTDPSRNCTPADPCNGQGTCNNTTHVCAAGTPLGDGTSCGGNNYCKTGTCTMPMCGNGIVEPGEQCDGGTGCKADCTWQCNNPATDCGTAPQCDKYQCSAQHQCQAVADTSQNGMTCTGGTCSNGACNAATQTCGNGITEGTEQCDFGAQNGAGTGCESNCTFSCQNNAGCSDGNLCDGTETCNSVTVGGHMGQKCAAGTAPATGTTCGTGKICLTQQCVTSTCGDGYVDASAGETCEPPNVGNCDASCHTTANTCGDGVLGGSEQCDDHNKVNLDGCDSNCKFEQVQRMTTFKLAFAPSTNCTKNALGDGIVGGDTFGQAGARTQITQAIDNGIADGSITVDMVALGLDDLSGTSDSSMSLGVITGSPATSTSSTYNGTSDLDWWYPTDSTTIDASRVPTHILNGSMTGRTVAVGPGEILVTVSFVGVAVTMDLFNTTIKSDIGTSGALTVSTNGMAPGHQASEHDVPSLTSYLTMGTAAAASCSGSSCRCYTVTNGAGTMTACPSGEMCGSTTALSLESVLVPSSMTGTVCNNFYTAANTLLDIYISGCKYAGIFPQVAVTQPDTSRDGHVYTFQADSNHHVVTCKKDNVLQTSLTGCLANAGYTSLFQFTSDRVIAK